MRILTPHVCRRWFQKSLSYTIPRCSDFVCFFSPRTLRARIGMLAVPLRRDADIQQNRSRPTTGITASENHVPHSVRLSTHETCAGCVRSNRRPPFTPPRPQTIVHAPPPSPAARGHASALLGPPFPAGSGGGAWASAAWCQRLRQGTARRTQVRHPHERREQSARAPAPRNASRHRGRAPRPQQTPASTKHVQRFPAHHLSDVIGEFTSQSSGPRAENALCPSHFIFSIFFTTAATSCRSLVPTNVSP